MLHTKYQSSIYFKIKKIKSFGCHGNQSSAWNSILSTNLVQLHARNMPAKIHQIWPSGIGGEVV